MRLSRRPRITSARPADHAIRPGRNRTWRLAAVLTAVLGGGSLLALAPAGPAAARPPGPAPGIAVSAAGTGTNGPRLFYASPAGQVWMRELGNPESGGPVNLGGRLVGGPAAVWIPPGSLFAASTYAVFGRGTDSALWWRYQTASGWSPWASLGGRITSAPAAAANRYGNQAGVYARGADGALWTRALVQGRVWTSWESRGGRLLAGTGPAAANYAGLPFVAVAGTDQAIWAGLHSSSGPGYAWRPLGGRTTAGPGIAVAAGGTIVAFARGTDSAAWYNQFAVGGRLVKSGWHSLGGHLTAGPSAIPTGENVPPPQGPAYLFVLGPGSQLWMRTGTWPVLNGWMPS